jgi:hypothetical protein
MGGSGRASAQTKNEPAHVGGHKISKRGLRPALFYFSKRKGFVDASAQCGKNPAWQNLN